MLADTPCCVHLPQLHYTYASVPCFGADSASLLASQCKLQNGDDGEKGLGPLVSTLSIGGEAAMAFRRMEKKSKVKTEVVPPEPGVISPTAKKSPRTLLTLKLAHGARPRRLSLGRWQRH